MKYMHLVTVFFLKKAFFVIWNFTFWCQTSKALLKVPMFLHLTKNSGYLDWWVLRMVGFPPWCWENQQHMQLQTCDFCDWWPGRVTLSHSVVAWCFDALDKVYIVHRNPSRSNLDARKTPGLPPKLAAFCRGTKKIRSVCRASSQGVLFLDGPYVAGKLTTLNIFVWNFSPRTLGENVHTFLTSIFFILGVGSTTN